MSLTEAKMINGIPMQSDRFSQVQDLKGIIILTILLCGFQAIKIIPNVSEELKQLI